MINSLLHLSVAYFYCPLVFSGNVEGKKKQENEVDNENQEKVDEDQEVMDEDREGRDEDEEDIKDAQEDDEVE